MSPLFPPLSVAPMMARTDRHFRYLMRLITRHTLLYTEMVTTGALLHGDAGRFLRFDPSEHPVSLQLGGDDPKALARCAAMASDAGYDEVNLNVGCPSDRVKSGCFGAVQPGALALGELGPEHRAAQNPPAPASLAGAHRELAVLLVADIGAVGGH